MSKILSLVGGWNRIAMSWPAPPRALVDKRYLKAGVFGSMTRYNGVLVTGATREGLFLDVMLPFKIGHRSLLIPWDQLQRGEDKRWNKGLVLKSGEKFSLMGTELDTLLELAEKQGAKVSHLKT